MPEPQAVEAVPCQHTGVEVAAEPAAPAAAGGLPAYIWVGGIIGIVVILLLVFAR